MKPSAANGELFSLEALARAPDFGSRVLDLLPAVGDAATTDVALDLFQRILALLGADAGVFLSFVRDDATRASYRALHAWPSRPCCVHLRPASSPGSAT